MPVYEYRCGACGNAFQKLFRSVAAAGSTTCPACGAPDAERALSSFAYHRSLKMQIEAIDPQIEKELDWAGRQHVGADPLDRLNLDFSGAREDQPPAQLRRP